MKYGKQFWQSTAERAMGTAAAAAIAVLGVDGVSLGQVDWKALGGTVALASIVTVLKCLLAASGDGNPGVGSLEVVATPGATADPAGEKPVEVVAEDGRVEGEYSINEVPEIADDLIDEDEAA